MEWQLFEPGTVPEWTRPEWYLEREHAPHLEQEGHSARLHAAARYATFCARRGCSGSIVDLGAGDGGFLSLVKNEYKKLIGFDIMPTNVQAAKARGVNVKLHDVVEGGLNGWHGSQVIAALEFFEHLIDPHGFARKLHDETTAKYLIASSPYTETDQSHYDFHTWAWDVEGYEKMFADAGWFVEQRDFAWICQIVLCQRR